MYKFGGHGVDVKLHSIANSKDIFWSQPNCNSFVRVAVPATADEWSQQQYTHRNEFGEAYYIVSVNGIGEVRWYVDASEYSLKYNQALHNRHHVFAHLRRVGTDRGAHVRARVLQP